MKFTHLLVISALLPKTIAAATIHKISLERKMAVIQIDYEKITNCCVKGQMIGLKIQSDTQPIKAYIGKTQNKSIYVKIGDSDISKMRENSAVELISLNTVESQIQNQADLGSSEEARPLKTAGMGARYGFFAGAFLGGGVDLIYDYRPNVELSLSAMRAEITPELQETPSLDVKESRVWADLSLVQTRFFLGNSFFVSPGLGMRRVGTDLSLVSTTNDSTYKMNAEVDSVVANISLGNYFQWNSGFFIGADWVGYTLPLVHSSKLSIKADNDSSDEDFQKLKNNLEEDLEKLGKTASGQLLLLNIGFKI